MKQIITDTLNGLAVLLLTLVMMGVAFALPIWLFTQTWMLVVWFTIVAFLVAWLAGINFRHELEKEKKGL